MSDENLSYSQVLLGNAFETILEATASNIPKVRESEFKTHVIPLLKRPFHKAHLDAYVKVVGELTNPLRVVSDDNPSEVLFEVPALIQTTGATLPGAGDPTCDVGMRAIYNEGERGVDINPMIASFLRRITDIKPLTDSVLTPIQTILSQYGVTIDISDESELVRDVTEDDIVATPVDVDSSFTDEYE